MGGRNKEMGGDRDRSRVRGRKRREGGAKEKGKRWFGEDG